MHGSLCFGERPLKLPWASYVERDAIPRQSEVLAWGGNASAAHGSGVFMPYSESKQNAADVGDESPNSVHSASRTPKNALYHSLIIPGWGQLDNGRKKKAALFFAAELFCIGGYLYENHLARQEGLDEYVRDAYRIDRNSFLIYWFVAKILGITDAYVDAHFSSFNVKDITPDELKDAETVARIRRNLKIVDEAERKPQPKTPPATATEEDGSQDSPDGSGFGTEQPSTNTPPSESVPSNSEKDSAVPDEAKTP